MAAAGGAPGDRRAATPTHANTVKAAPQAPTGKPRRAATRHSSTEGDGGCMRRAGRPTTRPSIPDYTLGSSAASAFTVGCSSDDIALDRV